MPKPPMYLIIRSNSKINMHLPAGPEVITLYLMKKKLLLLAAAAFAALLFTSCLPGDGTAGPADPANFLWGVWHGWVAPVSLIVHFFRGNIRLYEVYNTGWWYDFGFYIAVISGFGGLSLSRRKARSSRRNDREYGD